MRVRFWGFLVEKKRVTEFFVIYPSVFLTKILTIFEKYIIIIKNMRDSQMVTSANSPHGGSAESFPFVHGAGASPKALRAGAAPRGIFCCVPYGVYEPKKSSRSSPCVGYAEVPKYHFL